MKMMQQRTQALLPPDCGKSLEATPPEARETEEDADVVSGEVGEIARSKAQNLS